MKLIFVRHGETRFNAERRLTGQIDLPLSPIGQRQAQAVGERLANLHIDTLLSSTLIRARQTAQAIGEYHNKNPQPASWLNERFCGVLEGLTKAEMKQRYPESRKAYKKRNLNLAIEGGGETSLQFHTRVANGMSALSTRNKGAIVAVCHGGTIREAFNFVFHTHQNGNNLRCVNCSVSTFHLEHELWSMESWGDSCHLLDLDTDS